MRAADHTGVAHDDRAIYAVIPVFNRIEHTRSCLDCLLAQRATIVPVVVDGGSTDGTVELIPREFPQARLLAGFGDLWWGGATAAGIDWVLGNGARDEDYILLVNNDTVFGPDTLACLRETSERHHAAVGSLVVDCDDDTIVIDGGVNINWHPYGFSARKNVTPATPVKLDCDVLPGRCTLVPVPAVRRAGNVDARRFPHYLSDYEFTHRLKRTGGVRLAVDYRAVVRTAVEVTPVDAAAAGWRETLRDAFDRRSKSNIVDHLRFVLRHAPLRHRCHIAGRLVLTRVLRLLRTHPALQTAPASYVLRALRVSRRVLAVLRGLLSQPRRWVTRGGRLLRGPYLVDASDCGRHGLRVEALEDDGLVVASGFDGYYYFGADFAAVRRRGGAAARLYAAASRPGFKFRRFLEVRGVLRPRRSADPAPPA
jgi:GT2 family glycosyltransferase